jgi:hypothetical protein
MKFSVVSKPNSVRWWDYRCMNWKGFGRKQSWSNQGTILKFAWSDWGRRRNVVKPPKYNSWALPLDQTVWCLIWRCPFMYLFELRLSAFLYVCLSIFISLLLNFLSFVLLCLHCLYLLCVSLTFFFLPYKQFLYHRNVITIFLSLLFLYVSLLFTLYPTRQSSRLSPVFTGYRRKTLRRNKAQINKPKCTRITYSTSRFQ